MDHKVVVKDRKLLLDGFFRVEEVRVSHETFAGGMSPDLVRLNLVRGDAVAALVVNRARGTVVLVNQFRYATCVRGQGWMTEVIAGLVDEGETPEEAIRREILEEGGYKVGPLERITAMYSTPGITSERVILFHAETHGDAPVAEGGGLEHENEDIQVLELPYADAFAQLDRGEITDAKTIIALMWLRRRLEVKPG